MRQQRKDRRKKASGRLVMGRNCLSELLTHAPDRIKTVYVAESDRGDSGRRQELVDRLDSQGIPVQMCGRKEMDRMVDSDSHQSFIAEVHEGESEDLKSFLKISEEKSRSIILMLDSIDDPQNLGAIIRSAECFGVDAVVWSKNRGTDLTPIVSKTSAGASEIVSCIRVSNLVESMKQCQRAGYQITAAEVDPSSENAHEFNYADKTVIVMGSEGKGLRQLVKSKSEALIHIPLHGKINSLNVAQATSVLLSCWRAKKG